MTRGLPCSCTLPVTEGMLVHTETPQVQGAAYSVRLDWKLPQHRYHRLEIREHAGRRT